MLGRIHSLILIIFLVGITGCRGGYSFNGGSVPVEAESFSVAYFTNRAPQADPKFSRQLTEELIDLLNSQTRLDFVQENGDIRFEGYISTYRNTPVAVTANESSEKERLTISVTFKYIDTSDPAKNVSSSATRFRDYDANSNFDALEENLVQEIIKDLIQDIYDKSLGNW